VFLVGGELNSLADRQIGRSEEEGRLSLARSKAALTGMQIDWSYGVSKASANGGLIALACAWLLSM
jgi:hypothetical protein